MLDIAEELYGQQIKFNFTQKDVETILGKNADLYSGYQRTGGDIGVGEKEKIPVFV